MELIKISILLILIAVYNGLIINWRTNYQNKAAFWNKLWHSVGATIRVGLIFFFLDWKTGLGVLLIQWLIYDEVINLIRGKELFYEGSGSSGTGSVIDKYLSQELSVTLKLIAFFGGIIIITFI